MTHRLINTPAELDEAIEAVDHANDALVLRDPSGNVWQWLPNHCTHAPEGGWGEAVTASGDYPFLVLWWPGDVVVPAGSVT